MRESVYSEFWLDDEGHRRGLLIVNPDGTITIMPDDAYYEGTLDTGAARLLAGSILIRDELVAAARRLVAVEKRLVQMSGGMFTEAEEITYLTELAAAIQATEDALGGPVEPVSLLDVESRKAGVK